jgi:hypothetical protein
VTGTAPSRRPSNRAGRPPESRPGSVPPIRSDPIRSDQIRPDPIRPDPIRLDPTRFSEFLSRARRQASEGHRHCPDRCSVARGRPRGGHHAASSGGRARSDAPGETGRRFAPGRDVLDGGAPVSPVSATTDGAASGTRSRPPSRLLPTVPRRPLEVSTSHPHPRSRTRSARPLVSSLAPTPTPTPIWTLPLRSSAPSRVQVEAGVESVGHAGHPTARSDSHTP